MDGWLTLSAPATHSRTADTAIAAPAPCVCLICVCSFVITKGWETRREQTGLPFLFLSPDTWTKVKESKDTRRAADRIDCQTARDKTFTGKLSLCHKAPCFEYQRDSNSQINSEKVDQFCAPANTRLYRYRSLFCTRASLKPRF